MSCLTQPLRPYENTGSFPKFTFATFIQINAAISKEQLTTKIATALQENQRLQNALEDSMKERDEIMIELALESERSRAIALAREKDIRRYLARQQQVVAVLEKKVQRRDRKTRLLEGLLRRVEDVVLDRDVEEG
jgi:hypothetical protein